MNDLSQAFQITELSPEDELRFWRDLQFAPGWSDWRKQIVSRARLPIEQIIGAGDYDYRGAWKAGISPQPYEFDSGAYHLGSRAPAAPPHVMGQMLKSPNHPSAWMETFMNRYGEDPNQASGSSLADALRSGLVPGRGY